MAMLQNTNSVHKNKQVFVKKNNSYLALVNLDIVICLFII